MFVAVEQDLVVDLVGKDNQSMLAGDLQNTFQNFLGVQRTRRVIRVDHHNGFGIAGDLATDIVQIRIPLGRLITQIMYGHAARQAHGCCP